MANRTNWPESKGAQTSLVSEVQSDLIHCHCQCTAPLVLLLLLLLLLVFRFTFTAASALRTVGRSGGYCKGPVPGHFEETFVLVQTLILGRMCIHTRSPRY